MAASVSFSRASGLDVVSEGTGVGVGVGGKMRDGATIGEGMVIGELISREGEGSSIGVGIGVGVGVGV
jgi:hypothetical protein